MAGPFDFLSDLVGGGSDATPVAGKRGVDYSTGNPLKDLWGLSSDSDRMRMQNEQEAATHARGRGEEGVDAQNQSAAAQSFAQFVTTQPEGQPFNRTLLNYAMTDEGAKVIAKHGVGMGHLDALVKAWQNPTQVLNPGASLQQQQNDGTYKEVAAPQYKPQNPVEAIQARIAADPGYKPSKNEIDILNYNDRQKAFDRSMGSGQPLWGQPPPAAAPAAPAAAPAAPSWWNQPLWGGQGAAPAAPAPAQGAAPAAPAGAPAPAPGAAPAPAPASAQLPSFPDEATARAAVARNPDAYKSGIIVKGKVVYPRVQSVPSPVPATR